MRINSISVLNFGKLQDFTLDFNDDLNVICEKNGWGKSTIAAFIKVMLYGFDGETSRDQFAKERKRYYPWHGGTYGGSMIFTVEDRKYKLTRIFHEKQNLDEFDLRFFDTNMPSQDYSTNIGEELFNINSESFSRTVFIKQSDSAVVGISGDINSKLGNISDSIDLNKFENALELLRNKSNSITPSRKTGEINKLQGRASVIKGDLKGINSLEKSIEEVSNRIGEAGVELKHLEDNLSELNNQKEAAIQYEKNVSIRKSYDQILSEVNVKKDELEEAKTAFPGGVPGAESINIWVDMSRDINVLETTVTNLCLDFDEQLKFDSLTPMFALAEFDENEHKSFTYLADELEELKNTAASYELSLGERERFEEYKTRFAGIPEPLKSVKEKINKLDESNSIQNKYDTLTVERRNQGKELEKLSKSKPVIFIALASLFIFAGIGAMIIGGFKAPFIVGGIIAVIAGALFITLFVLKNKEINRRIEEIKKQLDSKDKRLSDYESKVSANTEEIRAFLLSVNSNGDKERYSETLQDLLITASDYEKLNDKEKEHSKVLSDGKYTEKLETLDAYLRKLNVVAGNSPKSVLADVGGKYALYKSLYTKKKAHDKAKSDLDDKISKLSGSLASFGIEPGEHLSETVGRINDLFADINFKDKAYCDALAQLNTFLDNNPGFDSEAVIPEQTVSLDDILKSEEYIEINKNGINERINTDRRTLRMLGEEYERKQDLADELEEIENAIAEKTVVYNRLVKTQDLLVKAKENLTAKYMGPLLNGFRKYYTMLTGESADAYNLDANINLTCVVDGLQRETKTLSIGYQDLDGMCMRLAMADAMYPAEKPVLVLDDPFVNMDDDKTSRLKTFLDEVSKEYQIIYMTCSDSRV